MRDLMRRLIAWLIAAIERDSARCPYECPRHREAWLRRYPRSGW